MEPADHALPMTANSTRRDNPDAVASFGSTHSVEPLFVALDDAPPAARPRKRRTSAPPLPQTFAGDEDREEDWRTRLRRWFWGSSGVGYAASLLLHLILLILASIVIVDGMKGDESFSTLLTQSEGDDFDISGPIDTSVVAEEEQPLVPPELTVVPTVETTIDKIAAPSIIAAAPQNTASEGSGAGSGFQFRMPESGKAVTKGSFTAWTVPEDPAPGQDYLIVIQIRLPEHITKYPSKDLTGRVIGTDGYRQIIPGDAPRYLPLKDHETQLSIKVPGAERLVKDTILIQSRRLEERQELEIVF